MMSTRRRLGLRIPLELDLALREAYAREYVAGPRSFNRWLCDLLAQAVEERRPKTEASERRKEGETL